MNSLLERPELRMMALIIGHNDVKKAEAVLEKYHVPVQYLCRGKGTASSELIDYLGLGTPEKAILLCVTLKSQIPDLFSMLRKELHLDKRGKGIVFTFPISGVNTFIMKLLNEDIQQKIREHIEKRENQMTSEITHSLLFIATNHGYSDEVMETARDAGVLGGTVIQARRLGSEESMKRWGIRIQPEKEIILILTEREKKLEVMKAIGEKYGLHSEAQGIVISIPVDAVTGLEASAHSITE